MFPGYHPHQEAALLLLGGLTFSMEGLLRVLLRSSVESNLSESVHRYSTPSYSTPSYSTPCYSTPCYSTPWPSLARPYLLARRHPSARRS